MRRFFGRILLLAAVPMLAGWAQLPQKIASNRPMKSPAKPAKKPKAEPVITPKPGSDLRSDIMDSLRERFEGELNRNVEKGYDQRVRFFVQRVRVSEGWAFVTARPILSNGIQVNYNISALKKKARTPGFQNRVVALLQRQRRRYWKAVGYNVGMRGRIWNDWTKRYGAPAGIFP